MKMSLHCFRTPGLYHEVATAGQWLSVAKPGGALQLSFPKVVFIFERQKGNLPEIVV
jgi:hypothetical protein